MTRNAPCPLFLCFPLLPVRRGQHFSIELTYNYGVDGYNVGDGFKGMGLRLPDLEGVVMRAKAEGGEIVSGPEASRKMFRMNCFATNLVYLSLQFVNVNCHGQEKALPLCERELCYCCCLHLPDDWKYVRLSPNFRRSTSLFFLFPRHRRLLRIRVKRQHRSTSLDVPSFTPNILKFRRLFLANNRNIDRHPGGG